KSNTNKLIILIFDQFEELFTAYQTHWSHRERFFSQVSEALNDNPNLRVVFSMREDYIADFFRYSHLLPDNISARFQLQLLNPIQAQQAIDKPVSETTSKVYDKN